MDDHPLTHDRWATPDDPEFCTVRFADLRKMERANAAIWAIARIVGNRVNEPETSGAQPLDAWIMSNLISGIESLCDHMADLVGLNLDESNFGQSALGDD
ncbi:hypothetical protein IB257_06145 [Achromobacter sp. ACM03]|uniref:hypothetical protein n=1 Tax=Achromobacter sp. ACM03 TaxID=2769300 RepID=UPI0019BDD17A|nr:hypothetical protein [Achromobacter sp. ACM03]MBD9429509.1 hypothetical protein [Achromobacter sp. ACM03]